MPPRTAGADSGYVATDQRRGKILKEAGAQIDFAGFVETDGVPDILERAWMKDELI
jgi:hypothetical protein